MCAQGFVGILGGEPHDSLEAELVEEGKVELRGLSRPDEPLLDEAKLRRGDEDAL